jgi:hypothetical protein
MRVFTMLLATLVALFAAIAFAVRHIYSSLALIASIPRSILTN